MREFKPNLIIRAQDIFYSRSLFLTFFPFANYYNRREVEKCSKKRDRYFRSIIGNGYRLHHRLFLSTRIKINPPSNEDDEKTGAIYGNVYLLQIGKADTAEDANAIIENVKARDLYSVYVYTGGFYYVYGAIGESEDDLAAKKAILSIRGSRR